MIIEVGTHVLAFDFRDFQATLDFDVINSHYKPAEITAIRQNKILCDIKFTHDNATSRGRLIAMLRQV